MVVQDRFSAMCAGLTPQHLSKAGGTCAACVSTAPFSSRFFSTVPKGEVLKLSNVLYTTLWPLQQFHGPPV